MYQNLVEYDGNLLRHGVFGRDELMSSDNAPAGQIDDQVCVFPATLD